MARPKKDPKMHGVYPRGDTYWMRWTENGKQRFASLGVSSLPKAIELAEARQKEIGKRERLEAWDNAVQKYIERKAKEEAFSPNTQKTVGYACKAFKGFTGVLTPQEVDTRMLKDFYKGYRRGHSESTTQGYVVMVTAFLRWCGVVIDSVKFTQEVEVRTTVASKETIEYLIGQTARTTFINEDGVEDAVGEDNPELCFILHAIFHAGMRKDEIINARPEWITLDSGSSKIKIPSEDHFSGFSTKSGRAREIPLSQDFQDFLHAWPDWQEEGRPYIIAPRNIGKMRGQRYRYDFRRPFENFMKKMGHPEITPHVGRHSFVTHLIQKGVPMSVVAYLSGDREPTLQKHYIHVKANPMDITSALSSAVI